MAPNPQTADSGVSQVFDSIFFKGGVALLKLHRHANSWPVMLRTLTLKSQTVWQGASRAGYCIHPWSCWALTNLKAFFCAKNISGRWNGVPSTLEPIFGIHTSFKCTEYGTAFIGEFVGCPFPTLYLPPPVCQSGSGVQAPMFQQGDEPVAGGVPQGAL
eukprot:EG_transcript_40045